MTDTSKPLALVTGVGPGTGASVVRRFARAGYRVAMLARDANRLAALESEIPGSISVPCDVSDVVALERAIALVGNPKVVVHNAVGGAFGTFQKIEAETLRRNFEIKRGRAAFAGFAPTKAAQRILAESLARDLGPKGVHVAYLVIDAAIDVAWQREFQPDKPDDFFISPASIADEVFHLAHQPRDAWSFLAEIRPFNEQW